MRDDALRFTGTLRAGHKERVIEVPAGVAARFGEPVPIAPGRRGRPVRATVDGTAFASAIVDRRGRHWLLVDDAVRLQRGWSDDATLDVALDVVRAANVEVSLTYAAPRAGVPSSASFRKWAAAALAGRDGPAELAIRIVGPDEGRELNRTYRGKDYATNVLSFPAERPEGLPDDVELPYLGDLVICADVVTREAAEQGKARADHYAHLTVHGVLHLLGWDHVEDAEAEAMEARERQILARLGIADPY